MFAGYKVDWALASLLISALLVGVSFWRAQRSPDFHFDLFDLVMVSGKVDRVSSAFMLTLAVSTWVIVDLQVKGKLTEGYFMAYIGAWIVPLVAKVVFNKPDVSSMTSTSTTTTEVIGK